MTTCQNVLYIFAHSGEKKNFKPKHQTAKTININRNKLKLEHYEISKSLNLNSMCLDHRNWSRSIKAEKANYYQQNICNC